MTGFGSAEGKVLGGRLSIEIRSVNHRYFNPQLKLPFELGWVEGPLRERLRQLLERGHVTVSARWIEAPQREAAVAVDLARARQLVAAAKELKKRLKLKGEVRSEEHTSELQSRLHLVCRLLLEKKKKKKTKQRS